MHHEKIYIEHHSDVDIYRQSRFFTQKINANLSQSMPWVQLDLQGSSAEQQMRGIMLSLTVSKKIFWNHILKGVDSCL